MPIGHYWSGFGTDRHGSRDSTAQRHAADAPSGGHNQWRRRVRGGVLGPRAVGHRRARGCRIGPAAARPGQDPPRAPGPSAARTIAEGDQPDVHSPRARGDRKWAATRGRRMAALPWAAPDAAPRRRGGRGGGAAYCAYRDASPERPSPVAAIAAPHRPDATASAGRHRGRRGLSGAVGDRAGFAASRDRIARGRLGEHRDRSRHAMDVRLGAPDRACSLAPPNPGQIVRPGRHRRAPAEHRARRARLHRRLVHRAGVARGAALGARVAAGCVDRGRVDSRLPPPFPRTRGRDAAAGNACLRPSALARP